MTLLAIIIIALALLGLIIAPLLNRNLADPLPDLRDPVLVDLEEERDALLRAIRELEERHDLSRDRRDQLRTRYEAKAARVLRQLDERTAAPQRQPRPAAPRRAPWVGIGVATGFVAVAVVMAGWVLPRAGQANVVASFDADVQAGRELQELQRAVQADPDVDNYLALADAYWRLNDAQGARETYARLVEMDGPAIAFLRLAMLRLDTDPESAIPLLETAAERDPTDTESRFFLAEYYFLMGDLERSRQTWQEFLQLEPAEGAASAEARIALIDAITPHMAGMQADASIEEISALADVFWEHGEEERAVDLYFRILTGPDPLHPEALSRTGQLLFLNGRIEDAVLLLSRAAADGEVEDQGLLFLGNGYFSLEDYEGAIAAWTRYVDQVGEAAAGRVPSLIAEAEARLAGAEPVPVVDLNMGTAGTGEELFAINCAACHGPAGSGGSGGRLAGVGRLQDQDMVSNTVRFGRGRMPAFQALLSPEEIAEVVTYVSVELQ